MKRRFHFRNLNLSIPKLKLLWGIIDHDTEYKINSVSFSHNDIGDEGAIVIADWLPSYIEEIGLVECNISDIGGRALLDILDELPALDMICIEQNNLSNQLKLGYQKFGAFNPDIMVTV